MVIETMESYPVSHISRLRMGSDGDGIRTLVLFQGCPLRCKYCINPFTWDGSRSPKMMSAQEIYDSILLDRPYMLATNGGVTFGGGEPFLHSNAIKEFAEINDGQFTIYVETSLNVQRGNLEQVVDCVDMYYVDIKTVDSNKYNFYTGGDLHNALGNLRFLIQKVGSSKIVVRIPLMPEITDEADQLRYQSELMECGVKNFDLFKYRIPE